MSKSFLSRFYNFDETCVEVAFPMKGVVTGKSIMVSRNDIPRKANIKQKYLDLGRTAGEADKNEIDLRPRPVFLVPGRGGRMAFLFGLPGQQDAWDTVLLNWMKRADTPAVIQKMYWKGFYTQFISVPVSREEVSWAFAGTQRWYEKPSAQNGPDHVVPQGARETYLGLSLFQGVRIHEFVSNRNGQPVSRAVVIPATGDIEPGFSWTDRISMPYSSGNTYFSGKTDFSPKPASSTQSFTTKRLVGAGYTCWTINPIHFGAIYEDSASVNITQNPGDHALRALSAEALGSCWVLAKASGLFGMASDTPQVGMYFPFPAVSTRVGWAVGLPHDGGPIVVEVEQAEWHDGVYACRVSYAHWDINGENYKRLFPLASLPSEAQADVAAAYLELDANVIFRGCFHPKGVKYPEGLDYKQTRLAIDAGRSDGSLEELLFDDLQDDMPPKDYASLGALSKVAISEGRNKYFVLPLSGGVSDFVSVSAITFIREGGMIVAKQGGVSIDSGEAIVAMRAGASSSASAPLTLQQVAEEFFSLPSWAAVTGSVTESADSHYYLVDENWNTNDGRFNTTDDAVARGLPLLLGFNTQDLGGMLASSMLGVCPAEVLSSSVRSVAT